MRKEGNCLNQKNEWAGTKIPDLEVSIPKGVARMRGKAEDTAGNELDPYIEGSKTAEGDKRVRQEGSQTFSEVGGAGQATHPPSKKVRWKEPVPKDQEEKKPGRRKRKPANFLEVLIEQRKAKARLQNQTMLDKQQEDTSKANTPVKVKVQRMEQLAKTKEVQLTSRTPAKRKRCSGGKGRQPSPQSTSKQAKVTAFFGRKSPKALNTRTRLKGALKEGKEERMEQNKQESIQGALSPLSGDLDGHKDHPSDDTGAKSPSRAPVGASEVRGRSSRDTEAVKKKAKKVLESWAQGPNKGAKRSVTEPRSQRKRDVEESQTRRGF